MKIVKSIFVKTNLFAHFRKALSTICSAVTFLITVNFVGSGCGTVGRAVASDTRGPGFESCLWQLLLNVYLLLTVCRKDENKEKEAGNGPIFFKKTFVIGK